jgi:hypothetical protein
MYRFEVTTVKRRDKRFLICFALICFLSIFTQGICQNVYQEVTAPEAKMILEENSNALIINLLSELEFKVQHIPKSINIPINLFQTTTMLPENKMTPLLMYCMGDR